MRPRHQSSRESDSSPDPAPDPATVTISSRRGWSEELIGAWRQRDLTAILAGRDIKLRYRQTALGVIWVVLQPVLVSGVFSFVFGSIAKLPTAGVPYFLFAYSGLVGWNLFANVLSRSSVSLIGNSALVAKIYFPRIILPLSTIVGALLDALVGSTVMLILILASGRPIDILPLLTLPLWIAWTALMAIGVGLLLSGLIVRYRDFNYVLPLMLQLLLFGSPVAYASAAVPQRFHLAYMLNPLAPLIDGVRWSFLGIGQPSGPSLLWSGLLSLIALAVGLETFRRAEARFADVI